MEEPNIDNCIQHLQCNQYFEYFNISNSSQFGFSIDNDQLIKFISSHFYSIDPQKLQGLPFPILYTILSDKELKLLSEDSLFDFINQLFQSREKVDDSEKYLLWTCRVLFVEWEQVQRSGREKRGGKDDSFFVEQIEKVLLHEQICCCKSEGRGRAEIAESGEICSHRLTQIHNGWIREQLI